MSSLRELVAQHGLGIKVRYANDQNRAFKVLESVNVLWYRIKYDDGEEGAVLKDYCTGCGYEIIE